MVTGGVVRLTGSGLGCPTWPQCAEGSYVPTERQEESWHKYVEFGNRLLTFVLFLIAIAALVAVLRHRPRRRGLVALAVVPLAGTLAQAVLGGITVLTGLTPWIVGLHFMLSIGLIAAALVLYERAKEDGDAPPRPVVAPAIRTTGLVLVWVALVVVAMGTVVTGSGPHSGDADTEARYPFDPRTMSWLHADVVLLFLGLTAGVILALHVTAAPGRARRRAWELLGISLAQGAVGYVQYAAGLPWLVVALHLVGAVLVWIASLRVYLGMRSRVPLDDDGPGDLTRAGAAGTAAA